jgi:hypothetical protein
MGVAFVVGVACLVAAWFVNRGSKAGAGASSSAPAQASTHD